MKLNLTKILRTTLVTLLLAGGLVGWVRRQWPETPYSPRYPVGKIISGNQGLFDRDLTNTCIVVTKSGARIARCRITTGDIGIWISAAENVEVSDCTIIGTGSNTIGVCIGESLGISLADLSFTELRTLVESQ